MMNHRIINAIIKIFIITSFSSLYSLNIFADSTNLSELPEPYRSAKLMRFNNHGWYTNGPEIEKLIKSRHVKIIIEIGAWMGASTRHMASLIPDDGKIYAVDTWEGSPNEEHDPKILETLYDQFLSNVIHLGLTHKIIPVRMESSTAANTLRISPDLIYLDATHTYEAVLEDLYLWFPFVKGHGIICGDDWIWGEDSGVGQAVTQFAKENNLNVYTNNRFWYLTEK